MQPRRLQLLSRDRSLPKMTGPALSTRLLRIRWWCEDQKQATKTELSGKAQGSEEKAPPDSEADREPESGAPPGKETAHADR